jgi:hypothetical protein
VKAADLPWLQGTAQQDKKDSRRLLWITVGMMVLGLFAIAWLQARTAAAKQSRAASVEVESRGR